MDSNINNSDSIVALFPIEDAKYISAPRSKYDLSYSSRFIKVGVTEVISGYVFAVPPKQGQTLSFWTVSLCSVRSDSSIGSSLGSYEGNVVLIEEVESCKLMVFRYQGYSIKEQEALALIRKRNWISGTGDQNAFIICEPGVPFLMMPSDLNGVELLHSKIAAGLHTDIEDPRRIKILEVSDKRGGQKCDYIDAYRDFLRQVGGPSTKN